MDRLLVDHLLRAGHYNAALKLTQSSGIEVSVYSVHVHVHTVLANYIHLHTHQDVPKHM